MGSDVLKRAVYTGACRIWSRNQREEKGMTCRSRDQIQPRRHEGRDVERLLAVEVKGCARKSETTQLIGVKPWLTQRRNLVLGIGNGGPKVHNLRSR